MAMEVSGDMHLGNIYIHRCGRIHISCCIIGTMLTYLLVQAAIDKKSINFPFAIF